ncbi:MAG: rhomboid family intramembrane serine protease [Candidatus Faecivicinus sp.]
MRFNQWLDRMERKFGKYAISNLMMYIVSAMAVVFVLDMLMPVNLTGYLVFNKAAILRGQLWRLVTFLFLPPDSSIVWILFSLYFYWMIGSALENQWGSFRFNMYYLFGMLGTIISGMITGYATNSYLNLSLFLGFALLYPDFQVNLFFFLPVRVKYLALIDAAGLLVSFVMGNASSRIALVMALVNMLLFFGGNLIQRVKSAYRRYKWKKSFRD